MKVENLMSGDWVIRKGVPSEPMQVIDFNTYKGTVFLDFQGRGIIEKIENIDPVLTTAKILEKNGFVYQDLPFEGFYEGHGLQIHGGSYADGHSNWYIICGINTCMNVTDVNELQHVFKLCGIKKELIL